MHHVHRSRAARFRTHGLAVTACLAILLAACSSTAPGATQVGGGTSPTSAPGTPGANGTAGSGAGSGAAKACTLLTASDIQSVTGLGVADTKTKFVSGVSQDGCDWTLNDTGASEIVLAFVATGGRSEFDKYYAPYNSPLPGVGDAAITTEAGTVMAVRGDALISVYYVEFPSTHHDYAGKLLQAALAHLQ